MIMSEAARTIAGLDPASLADEVLLGPATVVRDGHPFIVLRVAGESEERRARVALAVPYRAAEGDEVLVLGKRGAADVYVVGVLSSAGRIELEVPGDVTVRAVGGTLRLEGDRGVELRSPEVRVESRVTSWVSEKILQKSDELYQRVRGLLSVHAERAHTTIDRSQLTTAKTSSLLVEDTATINGKQIHLG
jgi:hypothetical protein